MLVVNAGVPQSGKRLPIPPIAFFFIKLGGDNFLVTLNVSTYGSLPEIPVLSPNSRRKRLAGAESKHTAGIPKNVKIRGAATYDGNPT